MMYSNRLGPKHFPTCQESNQVYPPLHLYILPPSQAEGIPSPPFAGPKLEIYSYSKIFTCRSFCLSYNKTMMHYELKIN